MRWLKNGRTITIREELTMLRSLMLVSALTIGLAVPIYAQQISALPNSGTFKLHSAWKGVGETIKVGDNHLFGAGTFWGLAYNDAGSGPLHMGPVVCPYTLETINGAGTAQGVCAWSDADGDKIFNTYTGKISPSGGFDGVNKITGGTGKFTGIQGQAPFQCRFLNDQSQATCTQQFEYQLANK
jgi:hypothetical protein